MRTNTNIKRIFEFILFHVEEVLLLGLRFFTWTADLVDNFGPDAKVMLEALLAAAVLVGAFAAAVLL